MGKFFTFFCAPDTYTIQNGGYDIMTVLYFIDARYKNGFRNGTCFEMDSQHANREIFWRVQRRSNDSLRRNPNKSLSCQA